MKMKNILIGALIALAICMAGTSNAADVKFKTLGPSEQGSWCWFNPLNGRTNLLMTTGGIAYIYPATGATNIIADASISGQSLAALTVSNANLAANITPHKLVVSAGKVVLGGAGGDLIVTNMPTDFSVLTNTPNDWRVNTNSLFRNKVVTGPVTNGVHLEYGSVISVFGGTSVGQVSGVFTRAYSTIPTVFLGGNDNEVHYTNGNFCSFITNTYFMVTGGVANVTSKWFAIGY